MSEDPHTAELTTRRAFYVSWIYGLWALISGAAGLLSGFYLLIPSKRRGSRDLVEAGRIADLPTDEPVEVSFVRSRVDGWRVTKEKSIAWVVKKSETDVVAFSPYCTHLACAYHWEEASRVFLCPCHTTTFSPDGAVIAGPAPRPLDRYTVKLQDGNLLLGPVEQSGAGEG